jgi:hypothetical protein
VSYISRKAWDTKYLKVFDFGLKPVQAVGLWWWSWMNQFIKDKRRLGHEVTTADGIGCPSMSTIVQADCLIVPIGRLSFRAKAYCWRNRRIVSIYKESPLVQKMWNRCTIQL